MREISKTSAQSRKQNQSASKERNVSEPTSIDKIKLWSADYYRLAGACRITSYGNGELKASENWILSRIALDLVWNKKKVAVERSSLLPNDLQHMAYWIIKIGADKKMPHQLGSMESFANTAKSYIEWAHGKRKFVESNMR